MQNAGSGGDGSGGDGENEGAKRGVLDALEVLVENLRKECYAMFSPKTEFDNLKERVSKLEEDAKETA